MIGEPKEPGLPGNDISPDQEENLEQKEKGELTFRDLKEEDFDEMLRIRNEAVADGAPMGNRKPKTEEEYFPELYKTLEGSKVGNAICLIAEKDGKLAGWIGGGLIKEAEIPTAGIGVAILRKEARGFKNFRRLAQEWLDRAKKQWGVKKLTTGTSVENRARLLYKRLGFRETGIRETENGQYVNLEKILE